MILRSWHKLLNSYRNLSLQNIITLPFLLQIFCTVSLVGYFSWQNSEKAIDRVTERLCREVTERVEQHLEDYLATPNLIVKLKQNTFKIGNLKVSDFNQISQDFWLTVKLFETVRAIYLGDTTGKFVYSKRERGQFYSKEVSEVPKRETHILNDNGKKQKLIAVDEYNPRSRPWYLNTLKTQENNWSEIYTFTRGELGITAAGLLKDGAGNIQGIVGVDLVLSGIDSFLENIEISENGRVFILERNGYLVATSSPEKPFTIDRENNREMRVRAIDSQENLIKATTKHITQHFHNLYRIDRHQELEFKVEDRNQLVRVLPYRDELGLDWLIVVVLPEADFMTEIEANTWNTILLCLLAIAIATCVGIYTSRKIAQPLTHLSQVTNSIARSAKDKNTGTSFYPIIKAKSIKELQFLARSFNEMAIQLKTAFRDLEYANKTLEKRVEQRTAALMAAKEAADTANHAKSQFLANMSHELRTPLHAILGFTQVALQNTALEPQQEDNLLIVKRSGEHLLTLINDVLEMSRIEAGSLAVDLKPCDLHLLLNNLLQMFQLRALEKNIQLHFELPQNIPQHINTDPVKLNQILINLIDNAIKYTEQGSVTLELQFREKRDRSILHFTITDTGCGILPSQLESIFIPFTQVKQSSETGTGLGLSISQQFARLLGGEITANSQLGRGSLFELQIPITIVEGDSYATTPQFPNYSIPQSHTVATSSPTLEPNELRQMPREWREKLVRAAIAVDSDAIWQSIAQIPPSKKNLVSGLTAMVENFAYDEIVELAENV